MERNKSISTLKEKKRKNESRPGRVIILSSFTVCSNREEICGIVAVRVRWGWEESSHVAERNRMTLLFSPQLTMDALSVHGSPCGFLDGILGSNAHIGNDSDPRITFDLRRRMWTRHTISYVTRLVSHYLLWQHTPIRASLLKFPFTDIY